MQDENTLRKFTLFKTLIISPDTPDSDRTLPCFNCSKHTQSLHRSETRLCKKGLQHCLACSTTLSWREILGNASVQVQGQAPALRFGERCSQPRNIRTVAGANDVIRDPLTMVNVKIKIGSSRTNCGFSMQRKVTKAVWMDLWYAIYFYLPPKLLIWSLQRISQNIILSARFT